MPPEFGELPIIHLKPGECYASGEAVQVNTVLGSCISVTFFHPQTRFGGIFHALLPHRSAGDKSGADLVCKYVDSSLVHLLDLFVSRRIRPEEIEVKLFGGADVLGGAPPVRETLSIGRQNGQAALAILEEHGLRVLARDIGGDRGRKLIFLPHTGAVWVRRLRKTLDSATGGNVERSRT